MAKRKTKTTLPDVTVESIIASKIAELEQQPCTCAILMNEVGEPVKIKCDRCKQIEYWKSHCICGKCKECLELLREYYLALPCECTYKTIQVEETIINPDTGLEEVVTVEKEVVDIQCERCKKIDSINKTLSDYEILANAFINEEDFDKYEVIDGVITSKVVDKGKPSDIDILDNKVMSLDMLDATLLLNNANQQVKINEHETTNAQLLLEIAMLKGGM